MGLLSVVVRLLLVALLVTAVLIALTAGAVATGTWALLRALTRPAAGPR